MADEQTAPESQAEQPAAETIIERLVVTFDHVVAVAVAAENNIPRAIALLNNTTFVQMAGLAHIETGREDLIIGLTFTKLFADRLLAIFPKPAV